LRNVLYKVLEPTDKLAPTISVCGLSLSMYDEIYSYFGFIHLRFG